jgi:hypothetical protein
VFSPHLLRRPVMMVNPNASRCGIDQGGWATAPLVLHLAEVAGPRRSRIDMYDIRGSLVRGHRGVREVTTDFPRRWDLKRAE